jgi:hypothetical protein
MQDCNVKLENVITVKALFNFWWHMFITSRTDVPWHMNGHGASLFWQLRIGPLQHHTAIYSKKNQNLLIL